PPRIRSARSPVVARVRIPDARGFRVFARRSPRAALAPAGCVTAIAVSRNPARVDDDVESVAGMTARPSVVYVLPDKMGGQMNIIASLLEYRQPDGFTHHAVLTHNHLDPDVRYKQPLR